MQISGRFNHLKTDLIPNIPFSQINLSSTFCTSTCLKTASNSSWSDAQKVYKQHFPWMHRLNLFFSWQRLK